MKVTVEEVRRMFPKHRRNGAMSGYIPMDVFNAIEKELRKDIREQGWNIRVIYRGPRVNPKQSMTRRRDATHAVLYHG